MQFLDDDEATRANTRGAKEQLELLFLAKLTTIRVVHGPLSGFEVS